MTLTIQEKQTLRQVFDAAVKASQDSMLSARLLDPLLEKLCSANESVSEEQQQIRPEPETNEEQPC